MALNLVTQYENGVQTCLGELLNFFVPFNKFIHHLHNTAHVDDLYQMHKQLPWPYVPVGQLVSVQHWADRPRSPLQAAVWNEINITEATQWACAQFSSIR